MTTWLALLRGINVGGRNRILMKDLAACFEQAGYTDVRTYIQSGNVVFRSSEGSTDEVAIALHDAIAAATSLSPSVVVRTAAELVAAREADPFVAAGRREPDVHLTFFADEVPDLGDLSRFAPDTAVAVGRELHLFLPAGMGRSKLAAALDRSLAPGGTSRNWRTVTALAEMAQALG